MERVFAPDRAFQAATEGPARLFEECGSEVHLAGESSGFAERQLRLHVLDRGDYTGEEWKDELDWLVREP